MATSSSESNTWVLDYCTIENNTAICYICSWTHNLIKEQLDQINGHIIKKHPQIYQSISSLIGINFRSYKSTQVYTIKNYAVCCNFCHQVYYGEHKTFRYIQKHITKVHTVGINKAKEICNWLQKHFGKNNVDAKSCRCYKCNNDIPNKSVYLMIHLEQVHDEVKIPKEIRPTGLWECTANSKKWMWNLVTIYLLTNGEKHANCNICDKRLSIDVNYLDIRRYIYENHSTVCKRGVSLQVFLEKDLFSIENNQTKCNICAHISSITCIDRNKELENHLSNEHKLDYAQINNFFNWVKLYQNVIHFQTLECNACKNISKENYVSLMRHFIEEHPIKFLLHLISKELSDKLKITKLFNDGKDIAKPGSSNQQPDQNINQSSSKITLPSLSDISKIKSFDNDTEGFGTSAISSYHQQSTEELNNREEIFSDAMEIINDTEGFGTSAISSYQQPTQGLYNEEEMWSDVIEVTNNNTESIISLFDCSNYDDLITNNDFQNTFL